jgi:hypothetical protein
MVLPLLEASRRRKWSMSSGRSSRLHDQHAKRLGQLPVAPRGRTTRNVLPCPGSVATSIRPPCASTIRCAIARPRPEALCFGSDEEGDPLDACPAAQFLDLTLDTDLLAEIQHVIGVRVNGDDPWKASSGDRHAEHAALPEPTVLDDRRA